MKKYTVVEMTISSDIIIIEHWCSKYTGQEFAFFTYGILDKKIVVMKIISVVTYPKESYSYRRIRYKVIVLLLVDIENRTETTIRCRKNNEKNISDWRSRLYWIASL